MVPERMVVVGASAGGVRALEEFAGGLPADFPAAVLVVLHTAPTQRSLLDFILNRAGPLPAAPATHGEPLAGGRIYVAVPDHHLIVMDGRVHVVRGPKENHYRPSVDVLFRSAARSYGARAIGVILSGSLSDGSSGMYALKRVGGIGIVQDPHEAAMSSMPLSALRRADIDYSLPAREIGPILAELVMTAPPKEPPDSAGYREGLKTDIGMSASDSAFERGIMEYGDPSVYTCPECNGVLFRIREGKVDRFRCHTGHGFSTQALADGLTAKTEATLWQALKTLQESAALLNECAARLADTGDATGAAVVSAQARGVHQRIGVLRELALTSSETSEAGRLSGSG
ncbi:MAG TPA: chemotaxis protein CheB [Burkholderiales bacterium]|nr:chemotaxis protein CheB [Burkholderiales bacterium]